MRVDHAHPQPEQEQMLPDRYGEELVRGYRVCSLLGEGPRCDTWLAWSQRLFAPVALKVARTATTRREGSRARSSIARELAILDQLQHPGFARLLDGSATARRPFAVTEYVDGPSLAYVLDESGPLRPTEIVRIGLQIGNLLQYLHSIGYAHHDLKPGNVLLRGGRCVLIDLASAEPLGSMPRPGGPRGTDGYMSAQQQACRAVTAGDDVYAMGALLHALLTGDRGITCHITRTRARGSQALRTVVERLTSSDPLQRITGVGEACSELAAIASAEDVPWPTFAG